MAGATSVGADGGVPPELHEPDVLTVTVLVTFRTYCPEPAEVSWCSLTMWAPAEAKWKVAGHPWSRHGRMISLGSAVAEHPCPTLRLVRKLGPEAPYWAGAGRNP